MNLLVVTGLSGAGKSMAVNALEDIGFFCIDNIPAGLMPRLIDFALQGENQLSRVAVVLDVRGLRTATWTRPWPRWTKSRWTARSCFWTLPTR